MNMDRLEESVIYYLKDGLWFAIKRFWFLAILFVCVFAYFGNSHIKKIPHRFQVVYIVRITKLKNLDYKSEIIKGSIVQGKDKFKRAGMSNDDILKLLTSKHLYKRTSFQKLYDVGPLITEISLPEDSSLLTIRGEGKNKLKVRKKIDSIFQEIRSNFKESKVEYLENLDLRLKAYKNDQSRTSYLLGEVDKVINEFGLTDTLIKQRNVLRSDNVNLRYKILDLENLKKSEIGKDHKIATILSTDYPITKRRAFYYVLAALSSFPLTVVIIFLISVFRFKNLPPLVPAVSK